MDQEQVFRASFTLIFCSTLSVSIWYRRRARRRAGAIPRRQEGAALIVGRLVVAIPLYLSLLTYMIRPHWLAWSHTNLPAGLRWAAVGMAALMIPLSFWIFRSLGLNVSETVLTKEGQTLVTWGPYRWVRHPLYVMASLGFLALSVVAANWFMATLVVVMMLLLPLMVRREEEALLARFGSAYAEYMAKTGRFLPRSPGLARRPVREGTEL